MLPNIYQYLFIITPDEKVESEVISLKQELASEIGEFSSLYSKPHITIGTILIDLSQEENLYKRIRYVCSETESFNVKLDGFSYFKAHTIFTKLVEAESTRAFMRACEESTKGLPFKKKWEPKAKNPHLTIGRELGVNYEKAKAMFSEREYESEFEVKHLKVMRRAENAKYDTFFSFEIGVKA